MIDLCGLEVEKTDSNQLALNPYICAVFLFRIKTYNSVKQKHIKSVIKINTALSFIMPSSEHYWVYVLGLYFRKNFMHCKLNSLANKSKV